MKHCWIHSATFQPMNGQPVWLYAPYQTAITQAVYEWIEFGKYPFRWRSEDGTFFLGHGLWQPRLDGEMPEPPPEEKPPVMWTDSRVSLPPRNAKVHLRGDLNQERKAIFLWVADGDYPLWKFAEETLADGQLLAAHMHWRLDPEEKPKV